MKKIIYFALIATVLGACSSESTDLDKLNEKRNKLKTELAEIEQQIAESDTSQQLTSGALVSIEKVKRGRFIHQIKAQGNIETEQDALINAETGGLIREILVSEGERVQKGQILAQIDASIIADNIQELQTALDFAKYNYDKQVALFEKGVGSEFQLKQAKSNVDNLQSRLQGLKTQRGKFNVVAPFSGVVDVVYAKIGEMAGPQSPIVRLVNNSEVKVISEISERLYSRVQIGTPLHISIPSIGDTVILASISHIGNYIHPTNRTFKIQAQLKKNTLLLPNMLAEVSITDYSNENALIIPSTAVLKDRNNTSYVFVVENDKNGNAVAKRMDVTVVESSDGVSEIEVVTGGLAEGMQIVLKGAKGITENDIIRIN
jgi:membrane fusion protein, multidrug efflux system